MSLTYKDVGTPIAVDLTEETDNNMISVSKAEGPREAIGKFEILPDLVNGFDVVYICGAMGSGKSYFVCEYAQQYRRLCPKNSIHVFSQKTSDPSLNRCDDLKLNYNVLDKDFLDKPIDITNCKRFHNSLIIFDDFMSFSDKKITETIINLILQCITLGRQYNISTVITSHLFYGFNNKTLYMNIQNECRKLVWFNNSVNKYQLRRVLNQYWGYTQREITGFMRYDTKSRYTMINRNPQYIMTRYHIKLI